MPDTHLAMPRTLSAPYAELLEAEVPRTMTTSEATNGTSAAAAAFARLLASGDQAMQPEASTDEGNLALQAPELAIIQKLRQLPDHLAAYLAQTAQDILAGREPAPIPGLIAACCDDASVESQRPLSLRDMLLGSTTIPALGMTIAEASQKTADLLAENGGPGPLTDEQAEALAARWSVLENAVVGAVPQTILDAASILDRIFPDDATHIPQRDIPAVRRVATFLHQVVEAVQSASPDETSVIPSIGLTFRQAADRVRELVERANNSSKDEDGNIEDKAELERREAARIADCHEWCRIIDAMMATPAQTIGDLFAKLERIACTSLGIRHLVPPDEEIALLEQDVQRLQPLWSGLHLAGRAGEPSQDGPIFASYDALLKAMRAESALPDGALDEEREPYEEAMEAAADHLASLAPATPRGAAMLLRYLFLRNCSTIEAEKAFLHGTEPNEEDLTDYQSLILWRTVKMLEALPAAANDQHQEPDAFADTVAAFEAEAPATLALPLEPTGRMVDAGASAAGITPAQFQVAYAAAVEALKLERAA